MENCCLTMALMLKVFQAYIILLSYLKIGVLEEAKFYGLTKAVEALEAIIEVAADEGIKSVVNSYLNM